MWPAVDANRNPSAVATVAACGLKVDTSHHPTVSDCWLHVAACYVCVKWLFFFNHYISFIPLAARTSCAMNYARVFLCRPNIPRSLKEGLDGTRRPYFPTPSVRTWLEYSLGHRGGRGRVANKNYSQSTNPSFAVRLITLTRPQWTVLGKLKRDLALDHNSPLEFEALYHWVNTGFFYNHENELHDEGFELDTYCLEIYKFSEFHPIPHLREWVLSRICSNYNSDFGFLPSTALVERLFGSNCGQSFLREYFIRHVASRLPENVNEYAGYNKLFETCEGRFAQQVALRLAECYNDMYTDKCHPSEEPGFQNTRAEAIRLGYKSLKSPEDYLNKVLEQGVIRPELRAVQV
jgi:hypothetical protein